MMRFPPLLAAAFLVAARPLDAQSASLARAKQEFAARNWDAAKQEFAALARATPGDVTPVLYLGRIALAQSETEEGIKHFERCAKIDDRNADCHAWLGNALGNAAMRANKFRLPLLAKRTKKEFERAVELDPGNIEGRSGLLQYYMQAPGFLGGSMDKAREQAAEIEKHSTLRGALAHALLADHEKKTKDSETAYKRAVAVAPDSVVGYNGLLNLYIREKRWSDAFATLDQVMERLPSEENVPLAVARVAFLSGQQFGKAEELVRRWIANPPKAASVQTKALAHFRLGSIYDKTGRRDLARSEYEMALTLNPRLEDARKARDGLRD